VEAVIARVAEACWPATSGRIGEVDALREALGPKPDRAGPAGRP
jgi:hypothetical protein